MNQGTKTEVREWGASEGKVEHRTLAQRDASAQQQNKQKPTLPQVNNWQKS